jgi:hypothetical protein
LHRHKHEHLAPALLNRIAKNADLSSERIASWLTGFVEAAAAGHLRATQVGDHAAASRYLAEARASAEVIARLAGYLQPPGAAVQVNIDQRKQAAVFEALDEKTLRALAASNGERPPTAIGREP